MLLSRQMKILAIAIVAAAACATLPTGQARMVGGERCPTRFYQCEPGWCCPEDSECASGHMCSYDGAHHFAIVVEPEGP